jgi:hypothetical protein
VVLIISHPLDPKLYADGGDDMTFTSKIIPYETYDFDLSSARTNEALSVDGIANTMTVIAAPSAFTLKINSVDNKALDALKGLKMDGVSITEIYITNSAGSGDGKIYLSWVG